MDHGPGDAERYRIRLRKQRSYQRSRRDAQTEDGTPERDDVAKVVLAAVLDRCVRHPSSIDSFVVMTAKGLAREKKRFDEERSAEVLRAMLDRHRQALEREDRRRRAAERGRET